MTTHESLAFILDTREYRETSSLMRVLTQHDGRVSLVARGVRKTGKPTPAQSTLQTFNAIRCRYYLKPGATLGNLQSAELHRSYASIRNSLESYALISYWFELLTHVTREGLPAPEIFALTLHILNTQETHPGLHSDYLHSMIHLCRATGYAITWQAPAPTPDFFAPDTHYFQLRTGAIQTNSTDGLRLTPDETAIFRALLSPAPSQEIPSTGALLSVLTLLNRYWIHHLEHPLKTYPFLQTTLTP